MKYLWSGVTLVAGVACVALLYRQQAEEPPAPITAPMQSGQSGASSADIQRMHQEIAELRRLVGSTRAAVPPAPSQTTTKKVPAQEERDSPADDAGLRAADEQQFAAYMGDITQSFNNEVKDVRWASVAAASVRAALEGDEVLRNLGAEVDCRQQSCRVEIRDDGTDKVMKSLPVLANNLAATLPAVSAERIDNGNGRSTMVLYMSRTPQSQQQVVERR